MTAPKITKTPSKGPPFTGECPLDSPSVAELRWWKILVRDIDHVLVSERDAPNLALIAMGLAEAESGELNQAERRGLSAMLDNFGLSPGGRKKLVRRGEASGPRPGKNKYAKLKK